MDDDRTTVETEDTRITVARSEHEAQHITVRVGTKEIYDAIITLGARLDRMTDVLENFSSSLSDHEGRIRTVERHMAIAEDHEQRLGDAEDRIEHTHRSITKLRYGIPASLLTTLVAALTAYLTSK